MIIQIDKSTGAVLSFDYDNTIEDIQLRTPSYIDVVKVTKSFLEGMTLTKLRKMADGGTIPYDEGATKTDFVNAILTFNPEK